jgi:hypothetical protein
LRCSKPEAARRGGTREVAFAGRAGYLWVQVQQPRRVDIR